MISKENFKRKCRRLRYLHSKKIRTVLSVLKMSFSAIIAICTLFTTMISLYIAKQSLDISEQALKVSQIALKSTSSKTEPIMDIDVDWDNDIISVTHETSDMYQIHDVSYGMVRTIAIVDDEVGISSVEVMEKSIGLNLEHGHTTGTDCSDEDAKKYNKEFELDLSDTVCNNTKGLDKLQRRVENRCNKSKQYNYWGVSPHFDYWYIEFVYSDIYGNIKSQHYIYKYEYSTSWRIYKLDQKQYNKYTKNIIYDYGKSYGSINSQNDEIIELLFSKKNFKKMENTKYHNFDEWFALSQFE